MLAKKAIIVLRDVHYSGNRRCLGLRAAMSIFILIYLPVRLPTQRILYYVSNNNVSPYAR